MTKSAGAERQGAEELFHEALELDPNLPTAHAALAAFAMRLGLGAGGARTRAAVAGPSSAAAESYYYAFLPTIRGRFAEADRHIQRMLDLDPFSTATLNNLAVVRNVERRFTEVREISQRMAAQYPKTIAPQQIIGGTYVEQGQPRLAVPVFPQLEPRFPQARIFEAMEWFAYLYAQLGDEPSTGKWLQRSADKHEWQVLFIAVHPAFARMRNSPGFRALKKRMGLDR